MPAAGINVGLLHEKCSKNKFTIYVYFLVMKENDGFVRKPREF